MSLLSRLSGLIPITIGSLFIYGEYLFILNIYIVLKWMSTCLNAPEELAIVFTILIIMALFGIFIFVNIIIMYLIGIGIKILLEN